MYYRRRYNRRKYRIPRRLSGTWNYSKCLYAQHVKMTQPRDNEVETIPGINDSENEVATFPDNDSTHQ